GEVAEEVPAAELAAHGDVPVPERRLLRDEGLQGEAASGPSRARLRRVGERVGPEEEPCALERAHDLQLAGTEALRLRFERGRDLLHGADRAQASRPLAERVAGPRSRGG